MTTLKQKMHETGDFLFAVELVTSRGISMEKKAKKTLAMSTALAEWGKLDWMSVTDNPGGNPMHAPLSLAKPLKDLGAETVIHLSCKDYSRNGLESQAWHLANEGFHNILALTGDHPLPAYEGISRSANDIEPVALPTLLSDMRSGLTQKAPWSTRWRNQ